VRVVVHEANVSDKVGVWQVIRRVPLYARWKRVLVDAGYDTSANRQRALDWLGLDYVVSPRAAVKGFTPQPCRWVVERTFAWLGKYRRLSKDYEATVESAESYIYAAMVHLMLRRFTALSF